MNKLMQNAEIANHLQHVECGNYIESRKRSEKLQNDIDEFLAKGGEIKQIPAGYSKFRDGNVPMLGVTRKKGESIIYDESIKETPDEVIEARNAKIRSGKIGTVNKGEKNLKKANCSKQESAQVKFLKDLISKFGEGDRARFCEIIGICQMTFNNAACGDKVLGSKTWSKLVKTVTWFKFTPKSRKPKYIKSTNSNNLRRKAIKAARLKAKAEGKKEFTATCAHHGETRYVFEGDSYVRCAKCREHQNLKHRAKVKNESQKVTG